MSLRRTLPSKKRHLPDMKADQMHSTYLRKIQLTLTISLHVKLHYVTDCYVMFLIQNNLLHFVFNYSLNPQRNSQLQNQH
jgi:hypothetical protein